MYRADGLTAGSRFRVSLGTRHQEAARRLSNRIERALTEGADSALWPSLEKTLPPRTFSLLAKVVNYEAPVEKPVPT